MLLLLGTANLGLLAVEIESKPIDVLPSNNNLARYIPVAFGAAGFVFFLWSRFSGLRKRRKS